MLTVDQARRIVLQIARSKPALPMAATDCLGLVLAEEIAGDIDSPPFDKAMVDGYALRAADLNNGHGELEVIEEIIAGATSQKPAAPGQCWRIMTGAPIPAGADAVVMHEHTQFMEFSTPSGASPNARSEPPLARGEFILDMINDPAIGQVIDEDEIARGEFTVDTFRKMLEQTRTLGPLSEVLGMIPGMRALKDAMGNADIEVELNRTFGIIDAMAPDERRSPSQLIDPGRVGRIAADAGVQPNEVADFIRQFDGMARLMKEMAGSSMRDRMRRMQRLQRKPASRPTMVFPDLGPVRGPAFGRLGRVKIMEVRFRIGQNIMRQGTSLRRGDIVLSPGREIRPVEIGLLAEVGRTKVSVIEPPTVAILSTGNELVPPDQVPTAGQIRNSNGPMLTAAVRAAGARPIELGTSRDEPAALRNALAEGLRSDVLIVSGGVSAGALDLVPGLLKELGVVEVFHKVSLKPGKPIWFGVRSSSSPSPLAPTLVFGLPGNPVSSLVCFELFVRPAIDCLSGRTVPEELQTTAARLTADFVHRGDRPTFHPAILSTGRDGSTITPLPWSGAADLRGLCAANALAIFPAGDREYAGGELIESLPLRP